MSSDQVLESIINRIQAIVEASEERKRPLEVAPAREELFGLFVEAQQAGLVAFEPDEEQEDDYPLAADGLCHELSVRWGLKQAAEMSVREQTALPQEVQARMRSLWSVMRMWMEWAYAWERWSDFHDETGRLRSSRSTVEGE